ncbi:unnamed protein product [Orchesella dallaii]|uniref:Tudor domain-containing protein n=1 Tax=Orchesella dallaii TaxID=48710 RepID=A0ABP1RKL4_9HEXA
MERRSGFESSLSMRELTTLLHELGLVSSSADRTATDVWPYKELPSKRIMPYRVKKVVSPFEIYLEYAFDSSVDTYNEWFPKMQEFYNNRKLPLEWHLKDGKALVGGCYACKDFNDNKWYRVRCHDTDGKTALVFYCDYGKRQFVDLSDLRELNPSYVTWAGQAFRAHLSDILPIDGGLAWPQEACNALAKIITGKWFEGIVQSRTDRMVSEKFPDHIVAMGIVLFEEIPKYKKANRPLCTVNAMMVDMGFASVIGPTATCHHTISPSDYGLSYFKSDLWNLGPENDESSSSSESESDTSSEEGFGIFSSSQCPEFPTTEAEEVRPTPRPNVVQPSPKPTTVSDPEESDSLETLYEILPVKIRYRLCHVILTYVLGPNQIFVQYKSRVKALKEMQIAIKGFVEDAPVLSAEQLQPGKFVACQIQEHWTRGVVKIHLPHQERVKVLFVDYGNETAIDQSTVKDLPELFHRIPSFVFRVHLDVHGLLPLGQLGWSVEACEVFRKYCYAWDCSSAIYYMFRRKHSEKIMLSEYTQEICFDFDDAKWFAGPRKSIDLNKSINKLRSHPMLRPFFCSFGVEIEYEIVMNPTASFWEFSPIYDELILKHHASYQEDIGHNYNPDIFTFVSQTAELVERKPTRTEEPTPKRSGPIYKNPFKPTRGARLQ